MYLVPRKAALPQHFTDANDSKSFFSERKTVCGPNRNTVIPFKALDGKQLTVIEDIQRRWAAHFEPLLNRTAEISAAAIEEIEPIEPEMALDVPTSEDEMKAAIEQLFCGKVESPDGISTELLKFGGPKLVAKVTAFFVDCWNTSTLPSDLKDVLIVNLYKGKGDKSHGHLHIKHCW